MSRASVWADNFQSYTIGNYLSETDSNWALIKSNIRVRDLGSGAIGVSSAFSASAIQVPTATYSADQYSKIAIKTIQNLSSASQGGISCRTSATAQDTNVDAYICYFEHTGSSGGSLNTVLARINHSDSGGAPQVLHQETVVWTLNDTIEMEVDGTGATVNLRVFKNGTQISGFNTGDTSAFRLFIGKPGIYSAEPTSYLDDFDSGDYSAGGGTTPKTATFTDSLAGGELL